MASSIQFPYIPYAVGIDFGTTKSALGYVNLSASGHPEPRGVSLDRAFKYMPSCVYVEDVNDKRRFLVGREARERFEYLTQPKVNNAQQIDEANRRYFTHFKLHLGTKDFEQRYHDLHLDPSVLAAILIDSILRSADTTGGELAGGGQIRSATITVPAGWNEAQKTQTIEAARAAGLATLSLVKEPTAALHFINHAMGGLTDKKHQKLMVVDYGGGTCDVTICETSSGLLAKQEPEIIAECTLDREVGGTVIDRALTNLFISYLEAEYGIARGEIEPFSQRIQSIMELAKEDYVVWVTQKKNKGIPPITVQLNKVSSDLPPFEMALIPEEFDRVVNPVVARIKEPIRLALSGGKKPLTERDIDRVYLVGGSSLLPATYKVVCGIFGSKKVTPTPNPREAVSLGAALWQYYQTVVETRPVYFQPIRYSTLSLMHSRKPNILTRIRPGNTTVLRKDETVLAKSGTKLADLQQRKLLKFRTIRDDQTEIDIEIKETDIQGVAPNAQETYVKTQLKFDAPMPKNTLIEVAYYVDVEDRLQLTAEVIASDGARKSVQIVGRSSISEDRINSIRSRALLQPIEDDKA